MPVNFQCFAFEYDVGCRLVKGGHMAFIGWDMFPLQTICWGLIIKKKKKHKKMLHFVKCFLWIYWDTHMIFAFILLMWCILLIDLCMLNHSCNPGRNPTWSWCWIQVPNIFVDKFFIYIHQGWWSIVSFSSSVFILTFVSEWCWSHKMGLSVPSSYILLEKFKD